MADKIKKIPYGISDFEKIIKESKYFVDKTRFIKLIEEYQYVFFIRPRRFGKSLYLNILENYYDINKKGMFDELFGGTYAGRNPAEIRRLVYTTNPVEAVQMNSKHFLNAFYNS